MKLKEGQTIEIDQFKGKIFKITDKNLILKLKNGYNIIIENYKNKKIKILDETICKTCSILKGIKNVIEEKKENKKQKNDLKEILIIGTGGTISSKVDYLTGGVESKLKPEDILEEIPSLKNKVNIITKTVFNKFSENIVPIDWITLAKNVDLNKPTIILHGTDTMGYSAAAISFMLQKIKYPIIFVGAQRSTDRPSTDTFINLKCAIEYCLNNGKPGVFVCMHETNEDKKCVLIKGVKSRKMHSSRRDAFKPINDYPFAKIEQNGNIEYIQENYFKNPLNENRIGFDPRVALVYFYPGFDPSLLDTYLEKKYKGVILIGTGLGHVGDYLFEKIKQLTENNIYVGMTTQTILGNTNPYVYSTGRKLLDIGVHYLKDIHPETAFVKLGWVFSFEKDINKIKEIMIRNFVGEINEVHQIDM